MLFFIVFSVCFIVLGVISAMSGLEFNVSGLPRGRGENIWLFVLM